MPGFQGHQPVLFQKLRCLHLRPCAEGGRVYAGFVSSWGSASYSRRQEPIAYIGGIALDLTTLLVVVHVVAAIAAALAFTAGYKAACYNLFLFDTGTFWAGHFWTPFTDPFFHDIAYENIWFVIGMYFFWRFGRDLEFYLGRASYGLLYAL